MEGFLNTVPIAVGGGSARRIRRTSVILLLE
jgi:hypothetical protein